VRGLFVLLLCGVCFVLCGFFIYFKLELIGGGASRGFLMLIRLRVVVVAGMNE
jgi:hypothetical protein